jgi:HEAT repeat protein
MALGDIKDKQAEPSLIALLSDNDWQVQLKAIIVLGEWKSQEAIAPLIQIAQEYDNKNRVSAIKNLGKIGGDQAINALIEFLKDKSTSLSPSTRDNAAEQLAILKDPRAIEPLKEAIRNIRIDFPSQPRRAELLEDDLKRYYQQLTGQEYPE